MAHSLIYLFPEPENAIRRGLEMELRDHPLMSYRGNPNWPPVWTKGTEKDKKLAVGELGILKYVHDVNPAANKIYLVIEHENEHYVGTLIFDDRTFCHQIANLLKQHLPRLIKEIGDLDVSDTL